MYLRAYLELKSKEPIQKPAIFSIGGFSAKTKTGEILNFDWEEMQASFEIKNELGVFDVELKEFDEDFFKESNPATKITLRQIMTPEFLTKCEINEILYECFETDIDNELIPLEVTKFELTGSEGSAEFKKDQLKNILDY